MKNKAKLGLAAWALASASATAAPQIDVFSPQGEAKGVRQIAVRFTEPMVAFGDPRLPDPFEVNAKATRRR
jgi:alpha-2-macroglobulin